MCFCELCFNLERARELPAACTPPEVDPSLTLTSIGANPQALNQSVAAGGPLQGVLFWLWDARSEGSDTRSSDQGITSSDSTWCGMLGSRVRARVVIGLNAFWMPLQPFYTASYVLQ